MDKSIYPAYFDANTNHLSYFQDTTFSEPGTSCQAFSRDVIEVANVLCAMRTHQTTKNFLQQPTLPTAIIAPQLNNKLLQRNTLPVGKELDYKTSASGPVESLTIPHDKVYAQPAKRKASGQAGAQSGQRKAYVRSENRKISARAWAQSEKGKACQKAYAQSEKGKASRKAYEQSEKRKAYQKAYRKTYLKSEKRKAYQKAYAQSEKRKAYQKAYQKVYAQSEKVKAYQKAYAQSEKGKACQKSYAQSEKGKAYQKAYQKAYKEVLKSTGDREQARSAGKQAAAFIRESNKAKNNELKSTSIVPTVHFSN
ncbi:hypothetical protein [Endozoicomonas sp. SCSIO W0465]|uniref:hypothetical protein n=1 Tax=Endozoicomonas sp. SCSIO W0465 TaxID=2918516 RepID=UPI002075535B|nr:hypothetical protein [Endozoicomonas sp. SCSIO W0465]USE35585.1 hypothetical protein MJO57_26425 [Endozoicomonas sp. SCSIO W0465]